MIYILLQNHEIDADKIIAVFDSFDAMMKYIKKNNLRLFTQFINHNDYYYENYNLITKWDI